jgi:ribosomal-protein-alanine N-acetyltransferase
MRPPETLESPRLYLRLPTLDDTEPIFHKYGQDSEVLKYLVWRPNERIEITRIFLRHCVQCWKDETAFPWVIALKADNTLLGMIEIRMDGFRADAGYVIARQYWGNGYTTEAVKSVVQWALEQESIFRVWATCDKENIASARVLERSDMEQEGILRRFTIHPNISNEPRDCYCYSIVK